MRLANQRDHTVVQCGLTSSLDRTDFSLQLIESLLSLLGLK